MAEAEISYLGATSENRAGLARDILQARLDGLDMRIEIFDGTVDGVPCARLRLAVRTEQEEVAEQAMNEVEALYLNGPAGGGGVRKSLTSQVSTDARLVPRSSLAPPNVEMIA